MPTEETSDNSRSPSQTLMDCLEDFGRSEAQCVIVVYVNEAGQMAWRWNTGATVPEVVGMLECARIKVLSEWIGEEDGEKEDAK